MVYRFYTADVFTQTAFGGNPLAILPQAQGLTADQMQAIAKEFNYSETVFVLPPTLDHADFRLRIFTPGGEIPFAGHPTVGTAYVLATIGAIALTPPETAIIFQEEVGAVPIKIFSDGEQVIASALAAAQPPEFRPVALSRETLGAVLSLNPLALAPDPYEVAAVSCGLPFLYVPVENRETLARAQMNLGLWEKHLRDTWAPHVYLFTVEADTIYARMFAPGLGIPEDPATGSAATALGGYLAQYGGDRRRWFIIQGVEMGRPSRLTVEIIGDRHQLQSILVSGSSVLISQGELFIEPGELGPGDQG